MKKALILLPVLVAVGLLVALGVGALPVARAQQPDATYTVFLPVICRNCNPAQPVSLVQVTQTLVQPANGVAQTGEPVLFKITIKNNGGNDITQLPLDDIFDTRYLEYVTAFPAPDLAVGGTLQWRDLTTYMPRGFDRRLPPGQSFDVTVQFKVTGCPAGSPVTNQVLVSGAVDAAGNEIRLASNGTQLMIACLNLEVTTPPHRTQAYLGEVVEFAIVLRNSGNSPVITLPLEEDFDSTVFQLVSATPPPTTADSATGRLIWSNLAADEPLAPGVRLTVTLRLRVIGCPSSGEVTNSAFVNGAVARVSRPGQGPIDFALPLATSDTTLSVPCAQLKVDKTLLAPPDGGTIRPGDLITFSLRVENIGNRPIKTLPVEDIFDANVLEVVTTSPVTSQPVWGHLDWDDLLAAAGHNGYLLEGQSVSATVAFRVVGCPVNPRAINRVKVSDAYAVENGEENLVPAVSDTETFEVECPAPRLEVTKTLTSPASGEVVHGDLVTFTIAVKNAGYWPVATLPLEDEFDLRYLEFVAASIQPDVVLPSSIRWLNLTGPAPGGFGVPLQPGETFSVTVTFRVIGCPTGLTTVNAARVQGALAQYDDRQFALPPAGDTITPVDIICLGVEVTKKLVDPREGAALLHEAVVFDITVKNTGNITITTVPLEDTYNPAHLAFKSSSVAATSATSGRVAFADLTQALGDLAPGATVTLRLTFEAIGCPLDQATTDQAKVEGAIAQSPKTTYPVPAASGTATVDIACADIWLNKTVALPADGVINRFDPNDTVTFYIAIKAIGNKEIVTLPLEDKFDASYLQIVSASPTPNSVTPGELVWDNLAGPAPNGFGSRLRPGETFTVTVVARGAGCPAGQLVTNYARVEDAWSHHSGRYELVPPVTDSTQVRVACPVLEVTKTVAPPLACGLAGMNDPVTFNVKIKNIGNTTLREVSLRDVYPAAFLQFNNGEPQPTSVIVQGDIGTILWDDLTSPLPTGIAADVPPGAVVDVTLHFTAIQSTQRLDPPEITNQVEVFGVDEYGHPTVDQASNHSSAKVVVADADLFITKQVKPESLPTHPGGLITYQVTYGNNGPDTATFVRILDTIPAGTEFVSDTLDGCNVNTGCYVNDLASGEGGTFEVTVRVPFGTPPGTIEDNRIRIESGQTPDGVICGIPDRKETNNGAGASSTVLADFGRLADQTTYNEDFTHEWLGQIVLGETSAPDGEAENDGWLNQLPHYLSGRPVELDLLLNTAGEGAERYGLDDAQKMYLRGWVDVNKDGAFTDNELVLSWSGGPGMVGHWDFPAIVPQDGMWLLSDPTHRLAAQFSAPFEVEGYTWVRLRLGYGKPPLSSGVENYGEVEDYRVGFFVRNP